MQKDQNYKGAFAVNARAVTYARVEHFGDLIIADHKGVQRGL